MTTQADYTAEQWRAIVFAPVSVAEVIMTADMSGPIGLAQELKATARTAIEASKASSNPLLRAIYTAIESEEFKKQDRPPAEPPSEGEDPAVEAMSKVTAAVDAVAGKSAEDGDAYKAYLMDVAEQVAKASKEGGFLGFGGTRVSGEERAALVKLATALGVGPPSA